MHPQVIKGAAEAVTAAVTALAATCLVRAVRNSFARSEAARRAALEAQQRAEVEQAAEAGFRSGAEYAWRLAQQHNQPRIDDVPLARVVPLPRNGRREVHAKVNRTSGW